MIGNVQMRVWECFLTRLGTHYYAIGDLQSKRALVFNKTGARFDSNERPFFL